VLDLPGARRGRGDGDEIGALIVIRAAARGLRVAEVASVRYPPVNGTRNRRPLRRAKRTLVSEWLRRWRLGRRQPARHDTTTMAGYGQRAAPSGPVHPGTARVAVPPLVRPAVPDPAPYLAGGRATGQAGAPPGRRRGHPEATPWTTPEPGAHRRPEAGENGSGARHREQQRIAPPESGGYRTGGYDTGVRHSGLYDTGVHRIGVYDSGVHRTDTYEFALDQPATGRREVGGGRRRLDAGDRRAGGRPDLTVIPGEGSRPADEGDDAGGWEPEPRPRPGHLRFLPGEQFDR